MAKSKTRILSKCHEPSSPELIWSQALLDALDDVFRHLAPSESETNSRVQMRFRASLTIVSSSTHKETVKKIVSLILSS